MKKTIIWSSILFVTFSLFFLGCQKAKEGADLVFINGQIITVDETSPQAEALAVKRGKIVAAGSNQEIEDYIKEQTEVIDLAGKTLIPGFIDSHAHFMSVGRSKMTIDLRGIKKSGIKLPTRMLMDCHFIIN